MILLIWFIGFLPHYFLFKKYIQSFGNDWTIGDRRIAVLFIWASWVGCIASLIGIFINSDYIYNDKKAKW